MSTKVLAVGAGVTVVSGLLGLPLLLAVLVGVAAGYATSRWGGK